MGKKTESFEDLTHRADTYQNYNAPVGNVINIATLAPRVGLASDNPVARIAYLVDRDPQSQLIAEIVRERASAGKPLIFLLPGAFSEMHWAFLQRIAHFDANEFIDAGARLEPAYFSWPTSAPSLEAILADFASKIKAPKGATEAEIGTHLKKLSAHFFLCHHIEPQDAANAGGQLIKDWIAYLASGKLSPASPHLLIAVLCVVLPDHFMARRDLMRPWKWVGRKRRAKKILRLIGDLSRQQDVVVLPQLMPINRGHLRNWILTLDERFRHRVNVNSFADAPHLVFPQDTERPYQEVYSALLDLLNRRALTGYFVES